MDTRVSPAVVVVVLVLVAAILVAVYYIVFTPSQTNSDTSQSESPASGRVLARGLHLGVPDAIPVLWRPQRGVTWGHEMRQQAEPL